MGDSYFTCGQTRLDDLQQSLGTRPTTWLTPGFSVTERTPGIAAQAGIKTLLDFVDDDVPFHLAHEERVYFQDKVQVLYISHLIINLCFFVALISFEGKT